MPHIKSLQNDNELLRNHITTQIWDLDQAMVSHRVDTGLRAINLRDKMERKIRTLKLEVEKSVEATEELRNEIKKFSETTEELRNDAKKSADMIEELRNEMKKSAEIIKHDRNDISRKRTISEPIEYDEGNSEEAPRLRKRICLGNQVEWTLIWR